MRPVPRNRLCVALDAREHGDINHLAAAVEDYVGIFKIGLTAFAGNGAGLVRPLAARRPVFLDLKLHDIPAQIEGAVAAVATTGATYLTVHAAGGTEMVKAAVAAAGDVVVLAVTVLTSLAQPDLDAVGIRGPAGDAVVRLAALALDAGVGGLVCSPHEVGLLRREFGADPVLVVPGIRPEGSDDGDQRRTSSARAALDAGADVLVVGRPITAAPDPRAAARALAEEIGA